MRQDEKLLRIAHLLRAGGWSLATAESCTGGLLAGQLTDVAGASTFFRSGIVSYSDEVKERLLGVGADVLASQSAVSSAVALEMAEGVRRLLGSRIGISTTGLAGPSGGSNDLPVGTVFIALSSDEGMRVEHCLFRGDRSSIRLQAVERALDLLLDFLTGEGSMSALYSDFDL